MQYRGEIDGLRAVAVLPVIFFHARFETFSGGYVGVDVFFVISGYLITSIILEEIEKEKFTLVGFYERRTRRILPALFLVMLCCIPPAALLMTPGQLNSFAESLIATTFFISNFHFWAESGYFAHATELKPLLHTWSLAIEEQFYLFYPLFILITWRLGKYVILIVLALVFIASLGLSDYFSIWKPSANFYWIPSRGWELLAGVFSGFFLFYKKRDSYFPSNTPYNLLSSLGLILILTAVFLFDSTTPFPGMWALMPVMGSVLIILFATEKTIVSKALNFKPIVTIGLLSYSFYLWHQPVFSFARIAFKDEMGAATYLALILLSFGLAFFSWRYVESYFRYSKLVSKTALLGVSLSMAVFFSSIALITIESDGAKFRFPFINDQLAQNHRDFTDYLPIRFTQHLHKDFESKNPKKKVLLIGDSYAEDILNSLYEVGIGKNYQFSTHHISKICGALLLDDYSTINQFTPEKCGYGKSSLMPNGRFDDPVLLQLLNSADEIWFASSWQEWQVDFLQESLNNVKEISSAKLIFFGTKNFGNIDLGQIIRMQPNDRLALRTDPADNIVRINTKMKRVLPSDNFIDLTELYCDELKQCRLFDGNGLLLSFDGSHLTKEGAMFFGTKLGNRLSF